MQTLSGSLQNADVAILPVLATVWNVKIDNVDNDEAMRILSAAMLDSAKAEQVWDKLADEQRGALQMLISASGKMPTNQFTRLFGEIRKMGKGQIEREKPHINPATTAEALFYKGFVWESFEQTQAGMRGVVYVPEDLLAVLPLHKTAYANLDEEDDDDPMLLEESHAMLEELEDVEHVQPADTSIVDDMTTLMAYLQSYTATVVGHTLADSDQAALLPYLLRGDEIRLVFLLGIGVTADLISIQEGKAYPKRAEARRWLTMSRSAQLKWLADAWRKSTVYQDLWHVPGLHPEPGGWAYDPIVGRNAIVSFLVEFAPLQSWWSIDDFIMLVKESEPDFQRPGGDYDSWYIRNDEGEYLDGFESWDAVEGALLEFYLSSPMHWLGLVDIGEDAARLTAYGRAFVQDAAWPNPPETEDPIDIGPNGIINASRKVSRVERFQLARFTTWEQAGDVYVYRLDGQGISRAAAQGIQTSHIAAFLNRHLDGKPMPAPLARLLDTWQGGASTQVTFEQLTVLRTNAVEVMDRIFETPAFRRYLGARLGPMACIVRKDQTEALEAALGEEGIAVEDIE